MSVPISIIEQKDFQNHPLLARLLELHDIPERIYIKGKLPEFKIDEYGRLLPRLFTVVGSRKYTNYGRDSVEKLISSVAKNPIIIISGLALGIDGIAHTQALKNNLITIAIPGSGLNDNVIHPKTNYQIYKEILENDGCVISELPPNTPPAKWTFPARNRIMSVLSDAVLIVEAVDKSGTLITARQSLELGRDIGAIPGSIFSQSSIGTNNLIRDGASPITCKEDLLELLHLPFTKETKENNDSSLTKDEQFILNLITENISKDELLNKSEMNLQNFLITISSLEIKGYIQETFGEVRRIV